MEATASAPATLPRNASTSRGASTIAHKEVIARNESPAPTRSTTLVASAGVGYVVLLVTLVLGMGAMSGMFESGLLAYADRFTLESIAGR